ncbi:hypothetical protein ACHQM5_006626 [Ranunculus cassubicifolius]
MIIKKIHSPHSAIGIGGIGKLNSRETESMCEWSMMDREYVVCSAAYMHRRLDKHDKHECMFNFKALGKNRICDS